MNIEMTKLVAVSVWFRGKTENVFVKGNVGTDGKVRVPFEMINASLTRMGCNERGLTYSVG